MILEVAVVFLALLWALSAWLFIGYSKRQRELAKKQKKEDKLRARAATARRGAGDDGAEPSPNPPATQDGQAPNAANP